MVKLMIKTKEFMSKKVDENGCVDVGELGNFKEFKIILKHDKPVVTSVGTITHLIKLDAKRVICKKVVNKKLILNPIYKGCDVLIVPKSANIWFKKPEKTAFHKRVTTDGVLKLSPKMKGRRLNIYKPVEDLMTPEHIKNAGWILIDELLYKYAHYNNGKCEIYLPKSYKDIIMFSGDGNNV